MTVTANVDTQLVDELGALGRAFTDILGPDTRQLVEDRLGTACTRLATEMCSTDDQVAARAVLTLMRARWPDTTDPPPPWWRTPAGRMAARSMGRYDTESVTRRVAAAMLGVHPGTVAQLVHRSSGSLDRHPDGGITRASVLARIARTPEHR